MSELQKTMEQSGTDKIVSIDSPLVSETGEHVSAEWSSMSAGKSLGRCLLDARKSRGLSVSDVAQAVKFSPRQINAIESDDFDKLPGSTFVRGFIRSYAKLLHLDPIPLLAMFENQVPQTAVAMHVPQDTGASLPQAGDRRRPFSYLSSLQILLAISVAVVIYVNWPTSQTNTAADSNVGNVNNVVVPPSVAVAEKSTAVHTEPAQQDAKSMQSEHGTQDSQPLDPDIHQLIFVFEGKSWVEVKDASRRVVFAQNNESGTRQVVNGKPPFALVIGNASHVQVLFEDRQIDLAPYTKVDVARLTLE